MSNRIEMPPVWQTDPRRVTRIAVLCGPALYFIHPGGEPERIPPLPAGWAPLDELIEQAIECQCAALWLLPLNNSGPDRRDDSIALSEWSTQARRVLDLCARGYLDDDGNDLMPYDAHPLTARRGGSEGQLTGLICQGHLRGHRTPMGVYTTWASAGDAWGLAGVLHTLPSDPGYRAVAFGRSVLRTADLLGMQLRFSPSYTGLQMLRQELASHHYDWPEMSQATLDLARAHRPTYVQWCRPFTPPALTRHGGPVTIYKYDRNASFLASAGQVPVGDPLPTTTYQPNVPGLYHITAHPPLVGERGRQHNLPGPFHVGTGAGEYPTEGVLDVWAWEPAMRLARTRGWGVQVREGYYWPAKTHRHDLFRVWHERLWSARQQSGGEPIARAIIKRAGVAAIGRLLQPEGHAVMQGSAARAAGLRVRSYEVDEQGELTGMADVVAALGKTDLMQPAWWSHIIANANERLLSALYAHRAYLPIAAYVDAVYVLSAWPDEDVQADRLGKFKLERSTPVSRDDIHRLNAIARDPAREGAYGWVVELARINREQDETADEGEGAEDDGTVSE